MTATKSPLAQAAKLTRGGIKAAVAGRKLPAYPDGIEFRVRARRASLMQAIDIELLNVPSSWRSDASGRPSPAWLELRDALKDIAARYFNADGSVTFIDVQVDPATVTEA